MYACRELTPTNMTSKVDLSLGKLAKQDYVGGVNATMYIYVYEPDRTRCVIIVPAAFDIRT